MDGQTHLKFEVFSDRKLLSNPFHWKRVEFNLPRSKGYRSDLPWVMKIRADGHLAAEVFEYIDDERAKGLSQDLTWRTARAYGPGCSRRGNQDRGGTGEKNYKIVLISRIFSPQLDLWSCCCLQKLFFGMFPSLSKTNPQTRCLGRAAPNCQ